MLILGAQSKSVKGGKDRAHNCSIFGYSKPTQEIFTSFHFGATVFICCACTGREKARAVSCYTKRKSRFCLHFKLLHQGGTLAGKQYIISIFLSDLRLLRTTLEHCVWSKQYILKSLALFSFCWAEMFVYVSKCYFLRDRETKNPKVSLQLSL